MNVDGVAKKKKEPEIQACLKVKAKAKKYPQNILKVLVSYSVYVGIKISKIYFT